MVKLIYKIGTSLLALLLLIACEEQGDKLINSGYLQLGVARNVEVVTKATDPKSQSLAVDICQTVAGKDSVVKHFSDYNDMAGERVLLGVGTYKVKVSSTNKLDFEKPAFYGEEDKIVIKQGETIKASVTCYLSCVKVTTEFTRPVKEKFAVCEATISNEGGELTYDKEEKRAGYFQPGYLLVDLKVANKEGVEFHLSKLIEKVEAKDHYNLVFDLIASGDNNSGLDFDIKIDTDPTNDEEHTVTIPLPDTGYGQEAPVVKMIGENNAELANGATIISKTGESKHTQVVLESKNTGIKDIFLSAISSQFQGDDYQLPSLVNITKGEYAEVLKKLGFDIPEMTDNKVAYVIDFSQMITHLKVGDHKFMIMVRDVNGRESSMNFTVSIRATLQMLDIPATSCWAKFAYLTGYIENAKQSNSENYKFQIKTKNEQWKDVEGKDITIDEVTGNISQTVLNLTENTEYESRIVLNGDVYSDPKSFKTEKIVEIPNINFDSWTQSGKMWYPNTDNSNSYWATGNDGVTSGLAGGKDSNTFSSDDAVAGKAAKLVTINGVNLVKCAAGNLFIGSYATNASDKEKSVTFGRPYNGARPTRLTGWYKYKSCSIDHEGDPADLQSDICNVYVWLQDANGKEIARGDFEKGETVGNVDVVGGYQLLNIDIKYSDSKAIPTKITIVATSSKYGGKFASGLAGGLLGSVGTGSTLLIDEFQLLYDYEYSEPATK